MTTAERLEQLRAGSEEAGGIPMDALQRGHCYEMGNVNAYCPECSRIHSEREGRRITVLDCDYDTDK